MRIPPPVLPREHGAWSVLSVPMLSAVIAAGSGTLRSAATGAAQAAALLALSALCFFLSYVPVETLLRRTAGRGGRDGRPRQQQPDAKLSQARFWSAAYAGAGMLFLLPLLLDGYWLLLPFGGAAVLCFAGTELASRKRPKTVAADLLAVAGLTLGAPAMAYLLAGGQMTGRGLLLWLLNFLFFGSAVFYVHMKIHAAAMKREILPLGEKLRLGKTTISSQLAVLAALAAIAAFGRAPAALLLAFVPTMIHAFYGVFRLSGKVRFRTLGFVLLGESILFGVLVGVLQ